jgi:hypothetical protein
VYLVLQDRPNLGSCIFPSCIHSCSTCSHRLLRLHTASTETIRQSERIPQESPMATEPRKTKKPNPNRRPHRKRGSGKQESTLESRPPPPAESSRQGIEASRQRPLSLDGHPQEGASTPTDAAGPVSETTARVATEDPIINEAAASLGDIFQMLEGQLHAIHDILDERNVEESQRERILRNWMQRFRGTIASLANVPPEEIVAQSRSRGL